MNRWLRAFLCTLLLLTLGGSMYVYGVNVGYKNGFASGRGAMINEMYDICKNRHNLIFNGLNYYCSPAAKL